MTDSTAVEQRPATFIGRKGATMVSPDPVNPAIPPRT